MSKKASKGASKNASARSSNLNSVFLTLGFVMGIAATLGTQWLMQSRVSANSDAEVAGKNAELEDNFEFYTLLGNLEVAVPESSILKAEEDNIIYWLQAASFRDLGDAENLRVSLLLKNLDAQSKPITGSDGSLWHRVVAGPYQTRTEMNKAKETLVQMGMQPITLRQTLPE